MSVQTKVTNFFSTTKKSKPNKLSDIYKNPGLLKPVEPDQVNKSDKSLFPSTPLNSSTPSTLLTPSTPTTSRSLLKPKTALPSTPKTSRQRTAQSKRRISSANLLVLFEREAKKQKNQQEELASSTSSPLEPVCTPTKNTVQCLDNAISDSPSKIQKGPLKGLSVGLLEKVREKEAIAKLRSPQKTEVNKKLAMMRRFPELIRIIHSYFVGDKKTAVNWESLVMKCRDSYHVCIAIKDIQEHLNYLLELFPTWIWRVDNSNGVYVKIDKTQFLSDLLSQLKTLEKSLET